MKCSKCNKEVTTSRLPTGWKKLEDEILCKDCLQKNYVLRAVTFPVNGPVGKDWPELRETLKEVWGQTTGLSNWMLTTLYAYDVRRMPGMEKLPNMPDIYLYGLSGRGPKAPKKSPIMFPDICPTTIASMEQAIKRKYRATRYKLLWTNEVSLPNYRYPAPYIVHNKAWKCMFDNEGYPIVIIPMAGSKWTLRLRGDKRNYRKQLASFHKMVSGSAVKGELAIYRQKVNSSDHRNGVVDRDRGGQHAQYRIMCKLVAWLPKEEQPPKEGIMKIMPGDDSLLVCINAKDVKLWTINADHVKRWIAENSRKIQRRSEDRKMNVRRTKRMESFSQRQSEKYNRRMKTACDQIAAQVVNYANRCKFEYIQLGDNPKANYVPSFPWFRLWEGIKYRCEQHNITFVKETVDEPVG